MRRVRRSTFTAAALFTALATTASFAAAGANPVQRVSNANLAAGCHNGETTGTNFPNSEVETWVSVDPNHSRHSIVTWQQDRFSDGGAHAGGVAFSSDGNHYGQSLLPFGQCSGRDDYERTSDEWVSWGPDGVAYASGLVFDNDTARSGVAAATTADGGATWQNRVTMIADNDPAVLNDKNSVTADQLHPGVAYQVWDRLVIPPDINSNNPTSVQGPALISITHDHGKTWSTPSVMVDTSVKPNQQTIGNVIVEDPNTGKLYDFYNLITYTDTQPINAVDAHYAFSTSTDQGATWSKPTAVTPDTSVLEVDPNDPTKFLRAGGGIESIALDPATGDLYLAYEGSDFSAGNFDQAQVVKSTDGGASWSAPILAGPAGVPSFTPTITIDHNSTVNIAFNDLRTLQPGNTTTLPTAEFLRVFRNGDLSQGTEQQISPVFDWLQAPDAGGHMLGDYQGMATAGTFGAQPSFVTTQNAPGDRSDVFTGIFHGPFGGAGNSPAAHGGAQHHKHGPAIMH